MRKLLFNFIVLVSMVQTYTPLEAQHTATLSVAVNKPGAVIKPTMWGVFYEDINFAADGGLYAELIKNRSFEFSKPLMGWKDSKHEGGTGRVLIINLGKEREDNPRFARIVVDAEQGKYMLTNEGFRGIGIVKEKSYNFSMMIRKGDGNVKLRLELVNADGVKAGEATLSGSYTEQWNKYNVSIVSQVTEPKAKLNLIFEGKGTIDIDMVSLFPQDTWKNRANGMRADLVQMLADLKPGFIRFPGGCIVEGHELKTRYQWKKTVGDLENREMLINRWNTEFRHRLTPDYYQSFGLGFFEYFQLAEDIGAEPLPILNCGMACQYNTGEVVPMDQLDEYIQDALDLVEFANGPTTSRWGKLRADMGHPAPFNLKYIGIGNEQWDQQYIERYIEFARVLKQQYPTIQLISSAGPSPDGPRFDFLWTELKKLNADLIDEHYYKDPAWFLKNASRYDSYDRNGPKVFAGEYAAHTKEENQPESRNNWESALAEAAFMTGLERNADIVHMASYAPLLAHVEAWQWRPDLIWFDNLRVMATPNYYVQKIFSAHKGTHVVPITNNGNAPAGENGLYASATIDKTTKEVIVKLVNINTTPIAVTLNLEGTSLAKNVATLHILTATSLTDYNTLDKPNTISPIQKTEKISGNKIVLTLSPNSVTLVKVPCKKV